MQLSFEYLHASLQALTLQNQVLSYLSSVCYVCPFVYSAGDAPIRPSRVLLLFVAVLRAVYFTYRDEPNDK